jgi:preprotein translocase subunit YajC
MFNSVDADDRLAVMLTVAAIIGVALFVLYRKGKKAMERDRQATGALK